MEYSQTFVSYFADGDAFLRGSVNIYTKRTGKNATERFKFVTQIPITLYQAT